MTADKNYQKGLEDDIRAYSRLKAINRSREFNDFFDLLLKTVSEKMLWAFTGDNVKSYEDFLKIRGEVVSYLYPIQEVRGAGVMEKHLKEQLDKFYNDPEAAS